MSVIAPEPGVIQGMNFDEKGDKWKVDAALSSITPDQFDGLLLPGGVANPDKLRMIREAIDFVRAFVDPEKPVAAICHGPWTLIEADAVEGVTVTSWPSLRTDLLNAGADWVDETVVRHGLFVTSRKPDDIPAFNEAILELFSEQRESRAA